MSKLLVKAHQPDSSGRTLCITPQSAGWKYIGFETFTLNAHQKLDLSEQDKEMCLVILSGKIALIADDKNFGIVGDRESLFDGKRPYALYAPPGTILHIEAKGEVELAFCTAPKADQHPPLRLITPDEVGMETRGQGTNTRIIHNILPDSAPAGRLLVVEVYTPGGHWSSYPPHKHDRDEPPQETQLEETYYHRLNPKQGFAFQRVYTDDRSIDETMSVENGDVVMVPRGYHPVGAPHGYDLYYLNVMAGPVRKWIFKNDPAHEWIVKK